MGYRMFLPHSRSSELTQHDLGTLRKIDFTVVIKFVLPLTVAISTAGSSGAEGCQRAVSATIESKISAVRKSMIS